LVVEVDTLDFFAYGSEKVTSRSVEEVEGEEEREEC